MVTEDHEFERIAREIAIREQFAQHALAGTLQQECMFKTSNSFIARQCDQAGEVVALEQCIASGQVSAAQIEAHRSFGELSAPAPFAPNRFFPDWDALPEPDSWSPQDMARRPGRLVQPATEMLHWAEEYECCMMSLDDAHVPRLDSNGNVHSLWGRIQAYETAQPVQSANDKLLQIIAATYQIAGVYDAPEHVLDVLANPELATQEQIDALLPFAQSVQTEQETDAVAVLIEESWTWDGDQWQRPAQLVQPAHAPTYSELDRIASDLQALCDQQAMRLGALESQPVQSALSDIEQYRLQMAGISTAAFGYWKKGDPIHPDYLTVALDDVADLYQKYDELYLKHVSYPSGKDAEIARLTACLKTANASAEKFEREWYLRGDEIEALQAQPDNTAQPYEELRSIIDGGSESFTHKDAVQYLKDKLAQPEHDQFKPDYNTEAVLVEEMQRMAKRIEALEVQEPVAWQLTFRDEHENPRQEVFCSRQHLEYHVEHNTNARGLICLVTSLYTAPPQRQPLTEDEIDDIWAGCSDLSEDVIDMHEFAWAIEAKLKEKNT